MQYDLDVVFATGRLNPWPPAAASGMELFRRKKTVRYILRSDGIFRPDPDTPWADQQVFGGAILGSCDDFLAAHAVELGAIAQNGTPAQRQWLQLFLTACTPAKVPPTLAADLATANNADP